MSFTKLKNRIDSGKLPLVLAGPMVRRAQPEAVSVWIALGRRRRVRLEIYDASGAVIGKGERDTRAIGSNLHIACVTTTPNLPLAAGAVCEYNLFFDHVGVADDIPTGASLFDPRVTTTSTAPVQAADEARTRLTYASDGGPSRPSFVLPPPKLDDVRLLHGSCRKESGDHSDALEAADQILRDAFRGIDRRPHMLFLTGDNIYNDGCAKESFQVVNDAAPALLGWDESMPVINADTLPTGTASPERAITLSELSGLRWTYNLDEGGFSSTGAHLRPLFGLGETIALYLLTFADVLWPDDLDYERGAFKFRGTLPAIRRAFANLATYMIFDDHEVSNSWNITAEWVESVLGSTWGRRIYQNALAAYALCVAWGNTPDRFEEGPGKALFEAVEEWSREEIAGTVSPAEPLAVISARVGLPELAAFKRERNWSRLPRENVVRWDYSVRCPNLNIAVLDTYMWRAYEGEVENPLIIPPEGLSQQLDSANFQETDCTLIVVSNVAIDLHSKDGRLTRTGERYRLLPLLGFAVLLWKVIFVLLLIVYSPLLFLRILPSVRSVLRLWRYEPEYGADYEHQSEGFERLIAHAAHLAPRTDSGTRQSRVVFLSGDVHHAFCMRMEYWSRKGFGVQADPVEGVLAQLVSSPCKWLNPKKLELKEAGEVHFWAGWKDEPTLTFNTDPDESPWRFKKSPWVMEYEPAGTQPQMNPPPEWRYSLTVVRSLQVRNVPLEIPDRSAPTLEEQLAEMEALTPEVIWDVEQSHVLIVNNVADVSFDWTPGKRSVTQRVWWRGRPAVDQNWTVTRYFVSMEPPASPPPR